ncbi:MAG: phosphatidate cytidylyltransferase [Ignavibacteriales bacterium]|nr:phosphatidate cytidylyltransferase [Ignavibacteriales bacterium]
MSGKFSNLAPRIVVALVGIPVILFAGYSGGLLFLFLILAIGILALLEFFTLAKAKGADPQTLTAIAGLSALQISFFHERIQNFILPFFIDSGGISMLQKLQLFITVLFLFLVLVLIVELFRNKGSIFLNAGFTIFGVMYVGIFLASLVGIRELFGAEFPYYLAIQHLPSATSFADDTLAATTYAWGGFTVIAIFASIWMCDTAAYFGGLSMGKHKLFPRVSPNKSWEGAVCGFLGAVATMVLFQNYLLPYLLLHQAIVIGSIIGIFGQIGDLIESLLKRDANVKDSSGLIPGHGGVLDRFDSLIFVSPILYLYIDFVVLS